MHSNYVSNKDDSYTLSILLWPVAYSYLLQFWISWHPRHSTTFNSFHEYRQSNPFHTKRLQTFTVASSQQKSAFKEQKYLETAHWRSCECWTTKEFIPHWKGLVSPQNFALTEVLIPLGVLQYTHNTTIKCHNSASVRIILYTNHTLALSKALSQQTRGIHLVFRHIYHM